MSDRQLKKAEEELKKHFANCVKPHSATPPSPKDWEVVPVAPSSEPSDLEQTYWAVVKPPK